MKTKLFIFLMLTWGTFNCKAQTDDYSTYLDKAREKIEAGDCEAAQKLYNVYKELTGKNNIGIETGIEECQQNRTTINNQGYIDLGLPSGTLWKTHAEPDFYTKQEASSKKFSGQLPTEKQWFELAGECTDMFVKDNYIVVTGPNGKTIQLPIGYRDCNGNTHRIVMGCFWFASCSSGCVGTTEIIPKGYDEKKTDDIECEGRRIYLVK